MGKVPCEFGRDPPKRSGGDPWGNCIFDVIWHICSGQRCFQTGGGRDLPSSGDAALTMPKVPTEFRADRPTFVFQGRVETSRPRSQSAEDGASSTAGLAPCLHVYSNPSKIKLGVGTCRLQGVLPSPRARSPVSFEPIGQPLFFRGKFRQGGLAALLPRGRGLVHVRCAP